MNDPRFSWLHISDIHAGHGGRSCGLDQERIVEGLLRDDVGWCAWLALAQGQADTKSRRLLPVWLDDGARLLRGMSAVNAVHGQGWSLPSWRPCSSSPSTTCSAASFSQTARGRRLRARLLR